MLSILSSELEWICVHYTLSKGKYSSKCSSYNHTSREIIHSFRIATLFSENELSRYQSKAIQAGNIAPTRARSIAARQKHALQLWWDWFPELLRRLREHKEPFVMGDRDFLRQGANLLNEILFFGSITHQVQWWMNVGHPSRGRTTENMIAISSQHPHHNQRIDPELSGHAIVETLLHELCHAYLCTYSCCDNAVCTRCNKDELIGRGHGLAFRN